MNDNEKLIEEARQAIHAAIPGSGHYDDWVKAQGEGSDFLGDIARAALAVFEKAHTPNARVKESDTSAERVKNRAETSHVTPTDDELEALITLLSSGERESRIAGGSARALFSSQADTILAAGFRRTEVPEPSAEVRAAAVSVGSGEPCQQIAEEPEWEYGTALRAPSGALWDFEYEGTLEAAQGHVRACEKDGHDHGMDHCVIVRRSPRISVGEWVPMKQEGADDAV